MKLARFIEVELVIALVIGLLMLPIKQILHDGTVQVRVKNGTDQTIREVKIDEMQNQAVNCTITLKMVQPGKVEIVHFWVEGESEYRVTAEFMDGRKLVGGCGYVESRNQCMEDIRSNKILSKLEHLDESNLILYVALIVLLMGFSLSLAAWSIYVYLKSQAAMSSATSRNRKAPRLL